MATGECVEADHRFGMGSDFFVVYAQEAVAVEPTEASLDYPALADDVEGGIDHLAAMDRLLSAGLDIVHGGVAIGGGRAGCLDGGQARQPAVGQHAVLPSFGLSNGVDIHAL